MVVFVGRGNAIYQQTTVHVREFGFEMWRIFI